jgi:PAS domain S-box-containing protein
MTEVLKVLLLEDSRADAELLGIRLHASYPDAELVTVADEKAFAQALAEGGFDVVLSDIRVPGYDGMQAFRQARAAQPTTPFIFVSGTVGDDEAVEMLKQGATDYVNKNRLARLVPVIERAVREKRQLDAIERVRARHREEEAAAARLQAQKNEVEERLRLAVLATNDAVWDWKFDSGRVVWNRALATLFGHDLEETSAQWWIDHIHADDRQQVDDSIHAVIDGTGASWTNEYRFQRADGSYADVLDRGHVHRDAQGRAVRMIGAMLDLTARNAAAAALRESERQYQTLFELIDEGFCVIEFLDGPHGPLSDYVHVAANPAYLANAGIADVVGQRVRDMVPDEAEGWVEIYREVLLTGKPIRFERELVATRRYLALSAFRIDPPDRRQVAVLFQDVTQRHRAEIALRELNESLERRVAEEVARRGETEMEAIGQLTGGIAHDFNNLLGTISSSVQILQMRLSQGKTDGAERYLGFAEDSVRRAAALTHRLLAFSRQQTLDPRPLDVNRLVRGMEELIRRTVGPQIEVEVVGAVGLWLTRVDPSQLENSLLNLCINARDAMPEGGRLIIETANKWLDERGAGERELRSGQYVSLCVTDTGTGMTPEVQERIFDPYFTTKPIGLGTGLGLSMVYGFVRQSEGQVRVYSEVAKGTTMCLYLPRHVGADAPADETPYEPPAAPGEGETVLVVEDEWGIRSTLEEVLAESGYHVLAAEHGPAAMKILEGDMRIDLLISDVGLPGGMNGRQVADAAREKRPGLKVLFITGYADNAAVGNGLLEPGMAVLTKPFEIAVLKRRVKELVEGL